MWEFFDPPLVFTLHQFYKRVEIVFAFERNAIQALTTILRTFNICKDTLFEGGKEAFFYHLLEQVGGVVEHLSSSSAAYTTLLKLHLLAN